ncbi:MAG: cupredoxin domain-containing protein, partial [Parcubacteria group bacterium]|nr:cupredoxin domain-containing protein [Parcubacteria group bacterium]
SPFLPTRKPVPPDVHVPEPGEKPADESVAVPVSTATAGPNVENQKFRVFNIVARNGKYEPSTIIVNVGDTVHIDFTAEGGTYDFFLPDFGLTQTAGPGVKKVVEFQANYSGSFTFSCKNLCPSGGMEGALIVK